MDGRSSARRPSRRAWRQVALGVCALTAATCGGSNPAGPGPVAPLVPTTAPVIQSVTVVTPRAEVGDPVIVTAVVDSTDTSGPTLRFEWSANAGAFEGSGPIVTWRAVKGTTPTPVDVVITLTVVESYPAIENGIAVTREHRVTRSANPFRLHDSSTEIGAMSIRFLVDYFGDSTISPDACLVDFSNGCRGKDAEHDDIVWNRANRIIYKAHATVTSVLVDENRTFARVLASCGWEDADVRTPGRHEFPQGQCILTAVYETGRWWLCTSNFNGDRALSPAEVQVGVTRHGSTFRLPTISGGISRNRPSR